MTKKLEITIYDDILISTKILELMKEMSASIVSLSGHA